MSFWPFSNSFNSNSKLRKVLDQIVDLSKTTVDDFLLDPEILQELVSELHSIKASYNNRKNNVLQLQLQRNQDSNWNGSDLISVTSSTNENSSNRDGQGAKLLEILLEHISFLDLWPILWTGGSFSTPKTATGTKTRGKRPQILRTK